MQRLIVLTLGLALFGCGGGGGGASSSSSSSSGGDAPADAVDLATTNLVALRGQWGKAFYVDCAPGATGTVWGTDLYTDDSSPCLAAVHAGRLPSGASGRVYGYIAPPSGHFAGSERNGIATQDYGAWPGAYQFTAPDPSTFPPANATVVGWPDAGTAYRENPGTHIVWCPPNGVAATVWGRGPYTDDSSMCTAAVHAGAISLATGGQVTIRTVPALRAYPASEENGVTTMEYGAYEHAFEVVR
jgi:hypothetical protein